MYRSVSSSKTVQENENVFSVLCMYDEAGHCALWIYRLIRFLKSAYEFLESTDQSDCSILDG